MTPTVSLEPEVRHYLNDRYAGNETRIARNTPRG